MDMWFHIATYLFRKNMMPNKITFVEYINRHENLSEIKLIK